MKSLLEFKTIVEEEKSDYTKFDALVRAGLANKAQMQRLHKILDRMGEDNPKFSSADRAIIQNMFVKMVDLLTNNKQIFQQSRRAVSEAADSIPAADFKLDITGRKIKAHKIKIGADDVLDGKLAEDIEFTEENIHNEPPFVLLLKRKAIRLYPDNTKIALYYNDRLKKHFSIPFSDEGFQDIQTTEEVEKSTGDLKNACWNGYTAVGMKMKNGRKVPNCVPTKEEVEITEAVMDQLHKIVNDKQAQSVKFASGHTRKVDHFTASAITQVHKALNDDNKKKFADMVHKSPEHLMKAADFAFKHAK